MTARRTVIADAAITTIARDGMRGLTHRAVDRTAGLPEGSTSYYFRTRNALLKATMTRMAELDLADVGAAPPVLDRAAMTALMVRVVVHWLTEARERTLARYELTLEASRRPELHEQLLAHAVTFRQVAVHMLTAAGAPEPERRGAALMSYLDGLAMHQLTRVGEGDLDEHELTAACEDLTTIAFR